MKKALFLMLISIVSCTVLENGTFLSDGMQKEIIDEPYSFGTIKASISTNGNIATISFNFPGLYQIFYRSYNSLNYLVGEYFFEPIVE